MSYVKLFGSILDSTVWQEPAATKIVWITMLAMADKNGVVSASVPGLAKRAGVSLEECEEALGKFKSPDPYSRTKAHEGVRIKEAEGGWLLLNHGYYRDKLNAADRREYKAAKEAEYRAKRKSVKRGRSLPGERTALEHGVDIHEHLQVERADSEAGGSEPEKGLGQVGDEGGGLVHHGGGGISERGEGFSRDEGGQLGNNDQGTGKGNQAGGVGSDPVKLDEWGDPVGGG